MASFLQAVALLISVTLPSKALQFGGSAQVGQPINHTMQSLAEGQVPAEPGCYFRKLQGCPKHPEFGGSLWKHAMHAERYKQARINRTACEVDAKEAAMEWCGVAAEAIQVLFVAEPHQEENRQLPSWEEQEEATQRAREGGRKSISGGEPVDWGWPPRQQENRQLPSWEEQDEATQRAREAGGKSSTGSEPLEQGWSPRQQDSHQPPSWEDQEEAAQRARGKASESNGGSKPLEQRWAPQQEDGKEPLWGMPGGSQNGPLRAIPGSSSNESVYNPMEVVVVSEPGSEASDRPKEPGCFVRTPSGCTNHPNFSGPNWQHDTFAERSTTAMLNSTECEVVRKGRIQHWCGTEDVQMKHVAPLLPGCYFRTPGGCPKHPASNASSWRHEEYGENFTEANASRVACESTRRAQVVSWCGTDTVEMLFVPAPSKEDRGLLISAGGHRNRQEASMDPGCFVRTPSGCPQHPSFGGALWRHDDFGERSTTANVNKTACEVTRKEHLRHWCSTQDVEMMFVPKPPPGCYVRTPSGCPNHPTWGAAEWKHEEYGEKHANSTASRSICEISRKASVMRWCGTKDVQMAFIPPDWGSLLLVGKDRNSKDTGVPTEPGCFVRTPSGCPKHPSFNTTRWKHEEFSERSTKAGQKRENCEIERKQKITAWCGVEDIEMLYVPPIEPGCYIRTPSGCPNYPDFSTADWKHEEHGEQYTDAAISSGVCEVDRKAAMDEWCGSNGTEMMFIPALHN